MLPLRLVEEFFHFHPCRVVGKWKFHRFSTDFPLVEKWWNFRGVNPIGGHRSWSPCLVAGPPRFSLIDHSVSISFPDAFFFIEDFNQLPLFVFLAALEQFAKVFWRHTSFSPGSDLL